MSTVNISKNAKAPIQTAQHVRNGKYPGAELQNLIADRAGHAGLVRTKLVYRSPGFIIGTAGVDLIPASTSGTRYRWRFPYFASPFALYLNVHFQMAPQDNGSTTDPTGKLEIATDPSYTTIVGQALMHFGATGLLFADVPANFGGGTTTLQDPATPQDIVLVPVTPLTQYFGRFADVDYARIQSVAVWELSLSADTTNGYAPNNTGTGAPIFDEDRQAPADMGRNLWAYGASPYWHWSVETDAGVRSTGLADLSGSLTQSIGTITLSAAGTVAGSASFDAGVSSPTTVTVGSPIAFSVTTSAGGSAQTGGEVNVLAFANTDGTALTQPTNTDLSGWTASTWVTADDGRTWTTSLTKASISIGGETLYFETTTSGGFGASVAFFTNHGTMALPNTDQASGSGGTDTTTMA